MVRSVFGIRHRGIEYTVKVGVGNVKRSRASGTPIFMVYGPRLSVLMWEMQMLNRLPSPIEPVSGVGHTEMRHHVPDLEDVTYEIASANGLSGGPIGSSKMFDSLRDRANRAEIDGTSVSVSPTTLRRILDSIAMLKYEAWRNEQRARESETALALV